MTITDIQKSNLEEVKIHGILKLHQVNVNCFLKGILYLFLSSYHLFVMSGVATYASNPTAAGAYLKPLLDYATSNVFTTSFFFAN